jgi:hypothetical protein
MKGRTMSEMDDQDFQDLLSDANAEPDTYIHEDGSELEIVDPADLEVVYDNGLPSMAVDKTQNRHSGDC